MARSADSPVSVSEEARGRTFLSGSLALSIPVNLGNRAARASTTITGEHVAPDLRPAPCAVVEDPLAVRTLLEAKPSFVSHRVDDDGEDPAHGPRASLRGMSHLRCIG